MKATVNTKDLIKALSQVNRVNPRRATLPVPSSMLMEFSNNRLTLSSTNLECAIQVSIKCETGTPFALVLPKGIVSKFVRPNSPTTIFTEGNVKKNAAPVTTIEQSDVGRMNIIGVKPSDCIPMPAIPDTKDWLTLDAKWFCRMLGIVAAACAPDESRPVLTGISLQDGAMAAADGFRLHVVKSDKLKFGLSQYKNKGGIGNIYKDEVIVPHTAALVAQKLFEKEESVQVAIEQVKNQIHFVSKDVSLTSSLIQGSFPQYEQLIPLSFSSRLTVSAPLMVQRLDMMDTSMGSGIIKMIVREENVLNVEHSDPDGMMDYVMTVPAHTDPNPKVNEFKIAIAQKYLMSAIKPFSLCHLEMTNPSSPMKITGDIEELTHIIMPMFMDW